MKDLGERVGIDTIIRENKQECGELTLVER